MIKLQDINKLFDQRAIAGLHHISFQIKSGEVFALMGPNGSGKTTLINIISGKTKADSGIVTIDGELRLFEQREVEDQNVQKFLIASNKLEIDEDKKLQLARDFADIFEFTFQLRQNLSELSAGQRQKVLLASELINSPTLLLLDEPFTHLDPHTRKDILQALFEYIRRQDISVLWVTHDLEEATLFSDRIGLLNFGKLEQVGTPQEVIRKPRSLFAAKFLGYENFLSVSPQDGKWMTPWGALGKTTGHSPQILVIPANAFVISDKGLPVKVESLQMRGRMQFLKTKLADKTLYMEFSPQLNLPEKKLKVDLLWERCFLLPH
ncbi:MAG: ABC transporter ATP-binding protein [Candidatus Caldatribacteriota bacterium]